MTIDVVYIPQVENLCVEVVSDWCFVSLKNYEGDVDEDYYSDYDLD